MKKKRPRIKLELTQTDRIVEAIGLAAVVALWALTLTSYARLPEVIPIHFNAAGEVDGYGGKTTILLLPLIATVLYIGMTIANKFPHSFNYLIKITEENALRQYTAAARMMRYLKLLLVVLFGYFLFTTIRIATDNVSGLNTLTLSLLVGIMLVAVALYFIKSIRTK